MKKGFTLIELLAVIIILAVIALIVTPLILDVIDDAKKSAFESEIRLVLSAINDYCSNAELNSNFTDTENICADGVSIEETEKMLELNGLIIEKIEYDEFVKSLVVSRNNMKGMYNSETDDITITVLDANSILITYDLNGGTGSFSSQIKTKNENINIHNEIPVRDGYVFKGWGNKNSDTVLYEQGDVYDADESKTLYAIWSPIICKLTYGTGTQIGSMVKCSNEEFYVAKIENNTVMMLAKNNLDLETNLQSTASQTTEYSNANTHYTAYKNYLEGLGINDVTVTYFSDFTAVGCTYSSSIYTCTYSPNSWVYSTNYWSVPSSTQSMAMNGGAAKKVSTSDKYGVRPYVKMPVDEIYTGEELSLNFDLQGGTSSVTTQKLYKNISDKLTTIVPTKANHIFLGWGRNKTTADYLAYDVTAGNITVNISENTTLYAIWKKEENCVVLTGTGREIGNEIKCGTEEFYIVDANDSTTKMLAKNNLNLETNLQSTNFGITENINLPNYYTKYDYTLKTMGLVANSVSTIGSFTSYSLGCTYSNSMYSCGRSSNSWLYLINYWSDYSKTQPMAMIGGTAKKVSTSDKYGVRPFVTIATNKITIN